MLDSSSMTCHIPKVKIGPLIYIKVLYGSQCHVIRIYNSVTRIGKFQDSKFEVSIFCFDLDIFGFEKGFDEDI